MSIHFDENLSDLKTFLLHNHFEFLPAVLNFTQLLFNKAKNRDLLVNDMSLNRILARVLLKNSKKLGKKMKVFWLALFPDNPKFCFCFQSCVQVYHLCKHFVFKVLTLSTVSRLALAQCSAMR